MKGALFFLLILLYLNSCREDTKVEPVNIICACGKEDPINQLGWLNWLVNKSLNDKTGNYLGDIWIISYKGNDVIVTNMMLASGWMYHTFDCEGKAGAYLIEGMDPHEFVGLLTDSTKVYSFMQHHP